LPTRFIVNTYCAITVPIPIRKVKKGSLKKVA